MTDSLEKIWRNIQNLSSISESEKELLLEDLSRLRKEQDTYDFKLKRILKDKSIAVNILEATIEDLEKKHLEVEQANEKLSAQRKELQLQKQIIEENAKVLQQNLEKLEQSYKELEQFSYIASHDLKSPLRTIASFAQLLERRHYKELDKEGQEFIRFIVSGVNQMSDVIKGLLQYAQIDNDAELAECVDLNKILDSIKLHLQADIEKHEVQFISDQLPNIYGNKVGLIQLFQNLIDNAIKFRGTSKPLIKISCQHFEDMQEWEFRLTDNGVGMSEEFQEKVFLPFQRLSSKKVPGLGIGLAVCHKVVKLHQGRIRFESEPGAGTTFIFTLSSLGKDKS